MWLEKSGWSLNVRNEVSRVSIAGKISEKRLLGQFQRKIPGENSRGKPFGKIPGRYLGDLLFSSRPRFCRLKKTIPIDSLELSEIKREVGSGFLFFFFLRTFFAFIHVNLNILSLRSKLCNTDFTKSACCQVQAPISFPFSAWVQFYSVLLFSFV